MTILNDNDGSLDDVYFIKNNDKIKSNEVNIIYKFNPNQPRDEDGKWTDTGSTSSDDSEDGKLTASYLLAQKLTVDEKYYLREYTRNGYSRYNQYLANPNSSIWTEAEKADFEKQIGFVKSALAKLGENPETFFDGISYRGDVWKLEDRGLKSYERNIKLFNDAFENDSLVDYNVFMSTTQDFNQALDFAQPRADWGSNYGQIIYTIQSKKGAKIDDYSAYPKELEVLFSPGTKFKVVEMNSMFGQDNVWNILLEQQDAESKSINLINLTQKFDPNQPRDEDGQWTDTGGSSSDSQEDNDENNQEPTDDEISSINEYTDSQFMYLTNYEAIKNDPKKLAEYLDANRIYGESMEDFEIRLKQMSEEIKNGINKLRKNPKYQFTGDVFRSDSWGGDKRNRYNTRLSEFQDAFDNDEIVTYKTYMSTSTDSKVPEMFKWKGHKYQIDYIIKVKDGAFIDEFSQHQGEDEVLLLPGSKFKVIDIDQDIFIDDKESYLITLELQN